MNTIADRLYKSNACLELRRDTYHGNDQFLLELRWYRERGSEDERDTLIQELCSIIADHFNMSESDQSHGYGFENEVYRMCELVGDTTPYAVYVAKKICKEFRDWLWYRSKIEG